MPTHVTLAVASILAPLATAFPSPIGSPPGWQPSWIVASHVSALYADASGPETLGVVEAGTFHRLDAPALQGRGWVYNPLTGGWGWITLADTQPSHEPTAEDLAVSITPPDPATYLYAEYPALAPRLDCIISRESNWNPDARNPRSTASGLGQFINSTWWGTPQGQSGATPLDPYASIDAMAWMASQGRWSEWLVVAYGYC